MPAAFSRHGVNSQGAAFLMLAVLALGAPAMPAFAAEKAEVKGTEAKAPETLDQLFDKLYDTENPIEARQIERRIWDSWMHSGSDTIDSLMLSGVALMQQQDYARAEQVFGAAIDLKPDYAEAWNKRATVRFLAGNFPGSVADVENTLKLEPRHFGALAGLGMILERIDKLPEALSAYRRALAANPHMPEMPEKLKDLRKKLDNKAL